MKSVLDYFRKPPSVLQEKVAEIAVSPSIPDDLPKGNETVMVVEDESIIRECLASTLTALGYRVLEAADGQEGLFTFQKTTAGEIDLLLTDIVMPKITGKELAHCVGKISPQTKIVFCSGYPESLAAHNGMIDPAIPFLQKPVSSRSLAFKIREILDATQANVFME